MIELRAWGIPDERAPDTMSRAMRQVLKKFQEENPDIKPVPSDGLERPAVTNIKDIVRLIQTAGDTPAHVLYVNFRNSHAYIANELLYPLDKYIERDLLGLDVPDGPLLGLEEYLSEMKKSARYKVEIEERMPRQCWEVIRRECPYGEKCHFSKVNGGDWDFEPTEKHYHVWCLPQRSVIMALCYRRDMFREAGLPDRVPETMEELLEFAKKLTEPEQGRYGLWLALHEDLSWNTLSFLYSMGGRLVERDEQCEWVCVFDNDEAVEAYYYVARLFNEPFAHPRDKHKKLSSVVDPQRTGAGVADVGMFLRYIGSDFFPQLDPNRYGLGPVPMGPTGRASELNAQMTGIYAGLEGAKHKELRDAAWEYIHFYNGPTARRIRAKVFLEEGKGQYVQPKLLAESGFAEYIRQVPKGWTTAYEEALKNGIPEPYGKDCSMIYRCVSPAVNQIITDKEVRHLISKAAETDSSDLAEELVAKAKSRIKEILAAHVANAN